MSADFNPYLVWLNIPTNEQPPNLYRLLCVRLFESDSDIISKAAERQMTRVRQSQSDEYSELSKKILKELTIARMILLDKDKKAKYDERLRALLNAKAQKSNNAAEPPRIDLSIPDKSQTNNAAEPPRIDLSIPDKSQSNNAVEPPRIDLSIPDNSQNNNAVEPPHIDLSIPDNSQNNNAAEPPHIDLSIPDKSQGVSHKKGSSTHKKALPLKEYAKKFLNPLYAVIILSVVIVSLAAIICCLILAGGKSDTKPSDASVSELEEDNPELFNGNSGRSQGYIDPTRNSNSNVDESQNKAGELFHQVSELGFGKTGLPLTFEYRYNGEICRFERTYYDFLDLDLLSNEESYSTALAKIDNACELDPDCKGFKVYKKDMVRERAIALGLQWIANHQLPDGSWSFNHRLAPSCGGSCKNAGEYGKALNGATGLALLSFFGVGVTHKEGKYKDNVYKGLDFLCKNGKFNQERGSVCFLEDGGTIYSHGIAAICLSKAYAMTKDRRILPVAQGALNYICYHQDPDGGGWRYEPHQAGDTSATGWQMLALKSGFDAGLRVPNQTIDKASRFFDSVETDSGAKYGYTEPGRGKATTAIGLLSRMYLGWKHDNPDLHRGVQWLSNFGIIESDSYYNYFTTQVMYQYNGPVWENWRAIILDQLVNSQNQDDHEKGSWYHNGEYSSQGGRLCDTVLSIMIMETCCCPPRRIYESNCASEGFPQE